MEPWPFLVCTIPYNCGLLLRETSSIVSQRADIFPRAKPQDDATWRDNILEKVRSLMQEMETTQSINSVALDLSAKSKTQLNSVQASSRQVLKPRFHLLNSMKTEAEKVVIYISLYIIEWDSTARKWHSLILKVHSHKTYLKRIRVGKIHTRTECNRNVNVDHLSSHVAQGEITDDHFLLRPCPHVSSKVLSGPG